MQYIYDAPYADIFLCDGELNWHDFYYINPDHADEHALLYRLNRTGIEQKAPSLFSVERSARTPYCEIFCILSGKGKLTYRGKRYSLYKNQLVLMNSHEPHNYSSDPRDPLGMIWIEFLGSDSRRIMDELLLRYSPVSTGSPFLTVSREISLLQQHLMSDPNYDTTTDLYCLLAKLLTLPECTDTGRAEHASIPWKMAESYIQAHLGENISNSRLANMCGVSLPYFIKCFKNRYRQTPQQYIRRKRILKARHLLTRTSMSISQITEQLGFCNDSHFIRIFKNSEGVTPLCYRKTYSNP